MKPDWDAIVIGAGLAGLTCAARLSHGGMKVLVLEQHRIPGGCATVFRRGDFRVEAGLHEMDGFGGGNLKNKIFRELGLFDVLRFPEIPDFYRFVQDGTDIVLPHSPEPALEELTRHFPHEADSLRTYFHRIVNFRKFRSPEGVRPESLGEYLDRIFTDEKLKLVLCGNLMAFSDDPYNISLDYFAQAQGSFLGSGAVFVYGGSGNLSNALADFVRNRGGEVRTSCLVTSVNVDGKVAKSVSWNEIAGEKCCEATARWVISNASLPLTASHLLGNLELAELSGLQETGPSLFSLYLGFDKPLTEMGNKAYCTCIFPHNIQTIKHIGPANKGGFEGKCLVLTDYSRIDSGLAPPGKSLAVAVCVDYARNWEMLPAEGYQSTKDQVVITLRKRLGELIPHIEKYLTYCEAGTALTVQRYTLNPGGSVYGYARTPGAPPLPDIRKYYDNVFIASAWDKFGGGFSGAVYSGYFTAMEVFRQQRTQTSQE